MKWLQNWLASVSTPEDTQRTKKALQDFYVMIGFGFIVVIFVLPFLLFIGQMLEWY